MVNSATKQVLTKWAIGIVIGIVIAIITKSEPSGWLGCCWLGTGIIFCLSFAAKIAKVLGAISSFGGFPAYIVGLIVGFLLGLVAGPIVGIYELIMALSQGSDRY